MYWEGASLKKESSHFREAPASTSTVLCNRHRVVKCTKKINSVQKDQLQTLEEQNLAYVSLLILFLKESSCGMFCRAHTKPTLPMEVEVHYEYFMSWLFIYDSHGFIKNGTTCWAALLCF